MKALSKSLKKHLLKESKNGESTATLFAQSSLFATSLFLKQTAFYSNHDPEGLKTALIYQISALLMSHSKKLGRIEFLRRTRGFKVNLIANFTCLMLAILFEKFYEKSLGSLGVALGIAVLVLALLIVVRPSTDLGILGFILGAAGSVAYNLFGLEFRIWVFAAICFVLFGFKCWLDRNWLELEEIHDEPPLPTTSIIARGKKGILKSEIVEAVMVTD